MNERIQYLLSQYESNNCSREELEELFYYIRNVKDNEGNLKKLVHRVYEDIRKNHPSFTYVDDQGRLVSMEPDDLQVSIPQGGLDRRVLKKYTRVVLLGGIVVLSIIAGIAIKRLSSIDGIEGVAMNTLTKKFSQRSEHKTLLLPDSTQVRLNASSSLEFPDHFSGTTREVYLKGEAFFKIKQAANQPFIIHAGKFSARSAGGASCNFKAYRDENEVIVAVSQGKIWVQKSDKQVAELMAGREVKLGKADLSILEKNVGIDKIGAWQWGELIYDEVMLMDIVADLERVYNVKITIANNEKERQKLSVAIRREVGVEEALNRICGLIHAQLSTIEGTYVIDALQ
ncbi:MAG: FecR family protein [Agriterribacter sp.]